MAKKKSSKPNHKKSAKKKAAKKAILKSKTKPPKKNIKNSTKSKPAQKKRSPKMRELELPTAGDFPESLDDSILLRAGDFVLEKISDTRYCCMRIVEGGRRVQHVCFKTERGARFHMELMHGA
jgi:hypothetical protein